MILTQKNSSNVWEQFKWPLNGIRRYGYYKDIFLFESGRKCPHGEGLYAFKCSKAKYLNEALHKAITNNASTLPAESNGNATKRIINTKLSRFVIKEESEQMVHSNSSMDTGELNGNTMSNPLKQSPSLESKSSTPMLSSAPQTPTVSQTMSTALLEDESTSSLSANKSSQHNYVNGNSLISLPPLISLSFLNAPSTVTMENGVNRDYINAPYFSQLQQQQHQAEKQEIDPTLLSLALKINGACSTTNSKSSLLRKSLIRSSVSTVGTHDQDDESSAYHFNVTPIQQAIGYGTKSREESKKRPKNSTSMNSISSNTSSLNEINYIVPEILKESKLNQVNEEEQVGQLNAKSVNESGQAAKIDDPKHKDQTNVTKTAPNGALNESQIEYVIIDPRKTPAIKSSSDLVNKQRNAERYKHLQNDP